MSVLFACVTGRVRDRFTMLKGTIAARTFRTAQFVCENCGLDWQELTRRTGVRADLPLMPSDTMVPLSQLLSIYERIAEETGDDGVGARFGTKLAIGSAEIYDYVALTAPSLEKALANWARFQRMASSHIQMDFEVTKDWAAMSWAFPDPDRCQRQYLSLCMAAMSHRVHYMLGDHAEGLSADFAFEEPQNRAAYEEAFGPNVRFGQEKSRLLIPASLLPLKPIPSDPHLNALMERFAVSQMTSLQTPDTLSDRVSQAIAGSLRDGEASLDKVAAKLGMSRRSLQRQFEQDGTTFRKVLDGVRRSLAKQYLTEHDMQVGEVAYLLGYSDMSSFSRAAKGWFGTSPKAVKRSR
ncbi:AraC family transcriptional regulator [Roseibium litorale]|uniref:AraC family transcriptional regulator n=1 Tax=Roseibium litorale TaxID=2803841 RepID=A0ABR9CHX2_9HYPH|nr:AraC family transcriptional regulator [Roseibium litorale]MBD8889916.1 AraC family transcriptional regulator [Roseibium litorale]